MEEEQKMQKVETEKPDNFMERLNKITERLIRELGFEGYRKGMKQLEEEAKKNKGK
jgi:hypothetical protein